MSFLSEADLFITPSVIPESTTTSQAHKKGKKSSPIWAHTHMPLKDKDPITKQVSYNSESSSAMTKHINRYYPLIIIKL